MSHIKQLIHNHLHTGAMDRDAEQREAWVSKQPSWKQEVTQTPSEADPVMDADMCDTWTALWDDLPCGGVW